MLNALMNFSCCRGNKTKSLKSNSTILNSSESEVPFPFNCLFSELGNHSNFFIFLALTIAAVISVFARIRSVLLFESIIHEADPWFNFRAARYLSENGYIAYKNWFDEKSWFPSGRHIPTSAFHGMMYTSHIIQKFVQKFIFDISIKDICVFNGIIFSFFTVFVTYLINYEVFNKTSGLTAAILIAVIPGFISRSHAGSYDYESMAIFQVQLIIYFWIKSYKTGSMIYGGLTGLAYFYLNSTWGGVIFITNLISIHALLASLSGRGDKNLLQSFTSFVVVHNLLSYHVPFNSHLHISSLDAISPLFVLAFLALHTFFSKIMNIFEKEKFLQKIPKGLFFGIGGFLVLSITLFLVFSGKLYHFSGRVFNLFDPDHFKDYNPIVTSVAEHSGTKWDSLFLTNGILLFIAPLGAFFAFVSGDPLSWIIILDYISLVFFTTRMNRLKLLLAPALSMIGGYGIAEIIFMVNNRLSSTLKNFDPIVIFLPVPMHSDYKLTKNNRSIKRFNFFDSPMDFLGQYDVILNIVAGLILMHAVVHFISISLVSFNYNGLTNYIHTKEGYAINDDVKNAYSWIVSNTPSTSKILSWWDYGYQIAGFTNRTVIVDNFTADYFRIAIVGLIMSGNEELAIKYMRMFKLNYLLVFAPGIAQHGMGNDINKFYWMIRISQNEFKNIIDESAYTSGGRLDVHKSATEDMVNPIMYKTCFFDHEKHENGPNGLNGVNPDSNQQIYSAANNKKIQFKYLEEVYSTKYRTIRIYKLKDPSNFWMEQDESSFSFV